MKNLKAKLGYGVGAVGLDLSYEMFYSYLAIYLTDILHLPPAFLLLLTPIARIWDGINDPMMGTIVDSTNTKFGKYRPWVITGACCNAIILSLLFSNPFGLTNKGIGIFIYIAFMYIFWGMTNTMADIPFWSMVPSFTSDPKERDGIATIARTFSGIGQGIVSILSPIMLPILSITLNENGEKVADARGYSLWAIICAIALIFFASFSMFNTKERVHVTPKEKFTFKKIFKVVKSNDQLVIFMLFCMLSNAAWYMISGTKAHYFTVVVGDITKMSLFNTIGAVGSILGLGVIPLLSKFTERRRIYQTSLSLEILGFIGMLICGSTEHYFAMNFCYLIISIGSASMFVSQTVFLANIVDYGEVKTGIRSESITFSMKGFLQKMAYTIQTIILFSGLTISKYDPVSVGSSYTPESKSAISIIFLVCPIILLALSFIVFTFKFKLHGKFMENITSQINEKHTEFTEEV